MSGAGTSIDADFMTLRNITAYNPNNSFVSTGHILTISENGKGVFTDTISSLNISSFNVNTLSAQNVSTNNITVQSTVCTLYVSFASTLDNTHTPAYPYSLYMSESELYFNNYKITGNVNDTFWQEVGGNVITPVGNFTISTTRNLQAGQNAFIGSSLIVNSSLTASSINAGPITSVSSISASSINSNLIQMTSGRVQGVSSISGLNTVTNGFSTLGYLTVASTLTTSSMSTTTLVASSILAGPITCASSLTASSINSNLIQMTSGRIQGVSSITGLNTVTNGFSTLGALYVASSLTASSVSSNLIQMINGQIKGLSTVENGFTVIGQPGSFNNLIINDYSPTTNCIYSDLANDIHIRSWGGLINMDGTISMNTSGINNITYLNGIFDLVLNTSGGIIKFDADVSSIGSVSVTNSLTVASTLTASSINSNLIQMTSGQLQGVSSISGLNTVTNGFSTLGSLTVASTLITSSISTNLISTNIVNISSNTSLFTQSNAKFHISTIQGLIEFTSNDGVFSFTNPTSYNTSNYGSIYVDSSGALTLASALNNTTNGITLQASTNINLYGSTFTTNGSGTSLGRVYDTVNYQSCSTIATWNVNNFSFGTQFSTINIPYNGLYAISLYLDVANVNADSNNLRWIAGSQFDDINSNDIQNKGFINRNIIINLTSPNVLIGFDYVPSGWSFGSGGSGNFTISVNRMC